MSGLVSTGNWIRGHKNQVLVHGLIWTTFILYSLFLSGPLFARFEAVPDEAMLVQMDLPAETNNLYYKLEKLITSKEALEIQGWIYISGYDSDNDHPFIVIKSDEASDLFTASIIWDKTVADRFGGFQIDPSWTYFSSTIPVRKIDNGEYSIGLCLTRGENTYLQYSSQILTKSNTGISLIGSTP
jgi:hypothetical protein